MVVNTAGRNVSQLQESLQDVHHVLHQWKTTTPSFAHRLVTIRYHNLKIVLGLSKHIIECM